MTTLLRNFFKDTYEITVHWKQSMYWGEGGNLQALSHMLFSHKSKPLPYSLNPPLSLELTKSVSSRQSQGVVAFLSTLHYGLVRGSLVYNGARKAWLQGQRTVRQQWLTGQWDRTALQGGVSQQSWLLTGNWGKCKCLSPTRKQQMFG